MEAAQPIVADLEAMAQVADQGIVGKAIVENEHHEIGRMHSPGAGVGQAAPPLAAVIHILRGEGIGRHLEQ